MKLHEISAPARRPRKRVGRGLSAGQGKTAGRGTKGQRARTGFNLPHRFEGGQSSLIQRLPKQRGFRSLLVKPTAIRIDRVIKGVTQEKITLAGLARAGLLTAAEVRLGKVKLVGRLSTSRPIKLGKGITATKQLAHQLGITQHKN